jgi:hypothetical protein
VGERVGNSALGFLIALFSMFLFVLENFHKEKYILKALHLLRKIL